MYCPKCGTENPEDGSYCRKCGTDIASVGAALSGESHDYTGMGEADEKKKVTFESAFGKLAMGVAFMVISFILSGVPMGWSWWFWLLIPAFAMLGSGVAQIMRLHSQGAFESDYQKRSKMRTGELSGSKAGAALPEAQTDFVAPDSPRYETGELVPPSVVENTTRHLEMDKEGQTMTLPKRED